MAGIEQMLLMLERRLADLEAAAGIVPDPATVINPRSRRQDNEQLQQQKSAEVLK